MTSPSDQHPPKEQLLAFGLGKIELAEAEQIAEHLDHCPYCSQTVVSLQDDTFVALIRHAPDPGELQVPKSSAAPTVPQATLDFGSGVAESPSQFGELPPELRDHPRYEILELIGRGGMGDVFKAQHKVMHRVVALKLIKPELVRNQAAVERFRREVQAAARLHHPNIVTAHDAEQAGNLHFLVMEYVAGTNLDEAIRDRGPFPVAEACDYIRQAAEGLQHAHELGMVHRDIKPHNLMIEQRTGTILGDSVVLKILDFGLANFANEVAAEEIEQQTPDHSAPAVDVLSQLTQMGTMMGTPDYIAPEQARDAHSADIRADIYSLGCTFYTLLTGQTPFGEGSVLDKIKAHAQQDAPPLSEFRDDVPEEVAAVLQKMIAKDPAERYQTPAEVAAALEKSMTYEPPFVVAKPARVRRRPLVLTALVTILTAIAAGVIIYLATDTGRLEINSDVEIPGAKIVLTKNGTEYASFDVEPGPKQQTIRAGEYQISLEGAPPGLDLNVWSTKKAKPNDFGSPFSPAAKTIAVYRGGGMIIELAKPSPAVERPPTPGEDGFRLLATLTGQTKRPTGLHFSLDGRRVMSSCGDGALRVWNLETEKLERMFKDQRVTSNANLAISRDGRLAVSSTFRGNDRIHVWNLSTGEIIHTIEGGSSRVFEVACVPGTSRFVAGSYDGRIQLYDLETAQPIGNPVAVEGAVSLAAAPEGRVVVGTNTGAVHVVDILSGRVVNTLRGHDGSAKSIAVAPDGKTIAAGSSKGFISLWSAETREYRARLTGHTGAVDAVVFTPDGRHVLSGGMDRTLRIWNCDEQRQEALVETRNRVSLELAISPDGRTVLAGGGDWFDHDANKWIGDGDYGLRLWQLPHSMWPKVAVSPDPAENVGQLLDRLLDGLAGPDWKAEKPFGDLMESDAKAAAEFAKLDRRRMMQLALKSGEKLRDLPLAEQHLRKVFADFAIQLPPNADAELLVGYLLNLIKELESPAEKSDVQPGSSEGAKELSQDRVMELVSAAAGIPNDDWTKLASGTEVPSPNSLESKTLSLMLFSLRALPPAGIEGELPAIANLKKDFQYLPEQMPKPAVIAKALWISRTKGYASYIQPEYVTEVTVTVIGDTARGEVAFEKEQLYRGRVRYVARRADGDWRIEEFHLPNVGLSLQLKEQGVWERMIRAQVPDKTP